MLGFTSRSSVSRRRLRMRSAAWAARGSESPSPSSASPREAGSQPGGGRSTSCRARRTNSRPCVGRHRPRVHRGRRGDRPRPSPGRRRHRCRRTRSQPPAPADTAASLAHSPGSAAYELKGLDVRSTVEVPPRRKPRAERVVLIERAPDEVDWGSLPPEERWTAKNIAWPMSDGFSQAELAEFLRTLETLDRAADGRAPPRDRKAARRAVASRRENLPFTCHNRPADVPPTVSPKRKPAVSSGFQGGRIRPRTGHHPEPSSALGTFRRWLRRR